MLPRFAKRLTVFFIDIFICVASTYLAFYLRLGFWVNSSDETYFLPFVCAASISIFLAIPIFYTSGLYLQIFRYSGLPALKTLIKIAFLYGCLYSFIFTFIGFFGVPKTIGLLQPILLLLGIGSTRILANIWLGGAYLSILKSSEIQRVMIFGAGNAGRQLANAIGGSHQSKVVGFLDDDTRLHGHVINGVKVYSPDEISVIARTLKVNTVLLALTSRNQNERNLVIQKISDAGVRIRSLPNISEMVQGGISYSSVVELNVNDLLGRIIIEADESLLLKAIAGRIIMITGAGGSIGGELARQIMRLQPASVILVEHNEPSLYLIYEELNAKANFLSSINGHLVKLVPILASCNDKEAMNEIFIREKPDTIYHAAAYKHVPIVEENPFEGMKNNVFGTLVMAELAVKFEVSNFILISTDKAVRPTNVMGASKRLAEMILQAMQSIHPNVKFSMVRFGNVIASSGSVIPKFRQQIRDGGPLTITDFRMTRYFMTIPEAVQLVIQGGVMANGGEVFVLDMGGPVRILDLAKKMVKLSGLQVRDDQNPHGDIELLEVGLRPGEKLYEELLISGEPATTSHPKIFKASEVFQEWYLLQAKLAELMQILQSREKSALTNFLYENVEGYQKNLEIKDSLQEHYS